MHHSTTDVSSVQGREPGRFRSDKEIPPNRNLFVVNYEPEATRREDLEKFFAQWGTVDRVQMKDKYCFVEVCYLCCVAFRAVLCTPLVKRVIYGRSRTKNPSSGSWFR